MPHQSAEDYLVFLNKLETGILSLDDANVLGEGLGSRVVSTRRRTWEAVATHRATLYPKLPRPEPYWGFGYPFVS